MVDTSTESNRQQLRSNLIRRRNAIDAITADAAAMALARHCSNLLHGVQRVAGYFAMPGELNVEPLLAACRARDMQTYVPIVEGIELVFAEVDDTTPLRPGRFGIRIPDVTAEPCLPPGELDAVLLPLVGFDDRCHRMGMGGGYYDRSFAFRRDNPPPPQLIGCAFQCQRVQSIPVDWWDVPLDYVVTEAGVRVRR